jgi:hypothetical protein
MIYSKCIRLPQQCKELIFNSYAADRFPTDCFNFVVMELVTQPLLFSIFLFHFFLSFSPYMLIALEKYGMKMWSG